ncbi:MAG: DUF222 domain-containing protein [Blastococcus sp.]
MTVTPLEPLPWPDIPPPPGVEVHPARLGEMMPVAARTRAERASELERITRVEAQLAAYKVEIVAAAARASLDPGRRSSPLGGPSTEPDADDDRLPDVDEFFPDELALTLRTSRTAATTLTDVSLTLTERLPATWAALADGLLDWSRARALALELGWPARDTDPTLLAEVEADVLPGAMDLSAKQLRATARRELMRRDAAAAERRRKQAERAADVTVHSLGDGMAELRAVMPAPLAAATRDVVDSYARMAKAGGEPGTLGQLRVGVLGDLALRPWDTSRPPVTAELTVVAPLDALRVSSQPQVVAEVSGQPITAAQVRELLRQLDALCPGGLQAPTGGSLTVAIVESASGELRAAVTRPELERLARRGCRVHPGGDCECPVVDRPPPVGRYRPSASQRRFVHTRDRTCRHPGCANRAGWADLDHVVPHACGGPTDCANLCCLCRRHHRLKTHAHGWRFEMTVDGVLSVTTPGGITRTTRPPGHSPPGSTGVARAPAAGAAQPRLRLQLADDPAPF